MKRIFNTVLITIVAILVSANTVLAVGNYFNGFELDIDGWFMDGTSISRVASGENGITSADGSHHAEVKAGAFTRWGGYENDFPVNGYVTKVDIYLDMDQNPNTATDKRFDYSSAINTPDGNHRRDFIFSIGTNPAVAGQFVMSASNNAPGWPANPGRDPFVIDSTGWYTFRHTFQNNGSDVLEVVMDVLDTNENILHSWTLSDPTDVIGTTIGGNRYGWFTGHRFDFSMLAIDNSEKTNIAPFTATPTDKDDCKKNGWMSFVDSESNTFKNQGACVSYVQSNEKAGKR